MDKIALTAGYPFAGCTRIARLIAQEHGYIRISMSDVLMRAYCDYMQDKDIDITVAQIQQNKEYYRRPLHLFASEFENDFLADIERYLHTYEHEQVIIEKVREDSQARLLKDHGYRLFRIERPLHDVMSTAYKHGHTQESWSKLLTNGSENKVSDEFIEDTLTNSFSSDIIVKYLVSEGT
jgi:hypothetical protein